MENQSTEQKIVEAAKKIFTKRGYAATKTRDIAEESGINLALLNYYFGSKENLFKIVVREKFSELLGVMAPVLSDKEISLEEKTKLLVDNYTNLLLENEELPIFVLNELKNNEHIFDSLLTEVRSKTQPIIDNQLKERGFKISPTDFVTNIVGMTIFPFIAKPLFASAGFVGLDDFAHFIENRRKEIPGWVLKTLV